MGLIKKQGIQNTLIIYAGILIGFISLIFIQPHLLTATELGLIRIMLSFASLLAAIMPLGAPNINIKYLPRFYSPEKKHHGFFGLMMLFPLTGIILGCIALYLFKDVIANIYIDKSRLFVNYFVDSAVLAVFITFIFSFNAYCNAIFKTVFPSLLNDIINRVLLIFIIIIYYFGYIDLDGFVLSFVLIYAFQAGLLLLFIIMSGQPSLRPDMNYVQKNVGFRFIARYGLILSFTSISSVSLKFLDSMFLGTVSLKAVGIYSVAAFIALIIETPLNSLERVANSKIAHNFASGNYEEIKKIYYTSSRYLMLLGGFLFVMVVINISDLLSMLPPEFRNGAIVTTIVRAGAFVNMATGVNYPILINSSKYVWGSIFLLILFVMAFAGNWLLINVLGLGITGAAIATSVSSAVYNVLKYLFILKNFKMQPFNSLSLLILLIMAFSFLLGYFIPSVGHPILSIAIRSLPVSILFAILTYQFRIVPEFHSYIPFGKKG